VRIDVLEDFKVKKIKKPLNMFKGFISGGSGEIGFAETSFSNSRPRDEKAYLDADRLRVTGRYTAFIYF